ncbi:MAG: hypothetical protein LBC46_00590 [Treponema sp.]|jgi:DNA-binding CsgD family transcriptional regulator|nr:hypothetical protein [Treponema sp.]
MLMMFGKYLSPAMEEVDIAAYAGCRCDCQFLGGLGSGGQSGVDKQCDCLPTGGSGSGGKSRVDKQLDDWYGELRGRSEYVYNQEVQKQVPIQNLNADRARSEKQENKLLLPKPMFSQRDVRILQSILERKKYECIADEQNISLSSVKKRVRFLYDYLNLRNRASFMSVYEGHTIELGVSAP